MAPRRGAYGEDPGSGYSYMNEEDEDNDGGRDYGGNDGRSAAKAAGSFAWEDDGWDEASRGRSVAAAAPSRDAVEASGSRVQQQQQQKEVGDFIGFDDDADDDGVCTQ